MKTMSRTDCPPSNGYTLRKITSLDEFRALKEIWNDIAANENFFFPFLCFEWFEIWLEHFLNNNKLLILLVYRGDTLLAITPFIIKNEKFKGFYVRKIELIGNAYSHIRNFIFRNIDDVEKEQVLLCIFGYLKNLSKWDLVDLNSLPEERFNFQPVYQAIDKIGIKRKEYVSFGNWYLDKIDFNGDEYLKSRSGNIKNNIKRYRKSLEKAGKLEFVLVTDGNDEKMDHFMDHYYIVYQNSWKKKETDPTFHRDIAKIACKKGWLRLGFLFLENSPIAAQLWFVCEGMAHILKLVYDENYKKFIPGVILTAEMMKHEIDIDKVMEVDFGVGDDPYKKDWTPYRRERKGVLIFNKNVKAQSLFFLVDKILPMMNKYQFLRKAKETIKKFT
jgi:CelD/BcsL family acetyltransferase involved in cellulose biosynthesis